MWKTIQQEPEYEVNASGDIRNRTTQHVKSTRLSRSGYPRVTLYPSGKTYTIHRLLAEQFLPNPERLPYINHINGVKSDNRLGNLEWCTAAYNVQHAIVNKLMQCSDWEGKLNPGVKLDYGLVYSIKFGVLAEFNNRELGGMLSVDEEQIRRIKTGDNWAYVTEI